MTELLYQDIPELQGAFDPHDTKKRLKSAKPEGISLGGRVSSLLRRRGLERDLSDADYLDLDSLDIDPSPPLRGYHSDAEILYGASVASMASTPSSDFSTSRIFVPANRTPDDIKSELEKTLQTKYENCEIQSIQIMRHTRQEVKCIYFLFGDDPANLDQLGCVYAKSAKPLEVAMYRFENSLGTPTPEVVTYANNDLLLMDIMGRASSGIIAETYQEKAKVLSPERFVERSMVVMQVIHEMNKRTNEAIAEGGHAFFDLHLPEKTTQQLLEERLLAFLPGEEEPRLMFEHIDRLLRGKQMRYFSWCDAQPYNILIKSYNNSFVSFAPQDISLIDWELSCMTDGAAADHAMWLVAPTYLMPSENRLQVAHKMRYDFHTKIAGIDNAFIADYLAACLLKVGDQLMILKEGKGNPTERIERAKWFLDLYFATVNREIGRKNSPSEQLQMHREVTHSLFKSANFPFFASTLQRNERMR